MPTRTQAPDPDPMIGQTVLEFRIEKKLAEGGMGAVYLARHRLMTSALKVIKVLLPEYAKNPIVRQRFHREAEAASKLKHENILGIDNFGTLEDGQLFIMIPYLDGQPLDAYLQTRGGALSPYRALHLVVQLCDALDYAHARGIIHRDLKPGNVFLIPTSSNPYMLKLLDFGIAKIVGAQEGGPKTQQGSAIGTPGYMAVEQYERADEVTHLADVYSLAVMIWGMVTARPPWQLQDPAVLYYLQRTEIPQRPAVSVMPAEWADLLLAAMSVAPAMRPQSARELAMGLASALPAMGRLPSGAEILASMAPHFVRQAAPGDETVRNAAEVDRIGPLIWLPRETVVNPRRQIAAERDPVASVVLPQAGARDQAALPFELPTTLSAATGVANVTNQPRRRRWMLAAAVSGTVTLAVVATGILATRVSPEPASSPKLDPLPAARDTREGTDAGGEALPPPSTPLGGATSVGGPTVPPSPAGSASVPTGTVETAEAAAAASAMPPAPARSTGAQIGPGMPIAPHKVAPHKAVQLEPSPGAVRASATEQDMKVAPVKPAAKVRAPAPAPRPATDPDDVSGPAE